MSNYLFQEKEIDHRWFVGLLRISIFVLVSFYAHSTMAASLSVSPATGVYSVGSTFTMQLAVNTQGKKINAADGTINFNPSELQVVSVTRGGSIFNLWTAEPSFSNTSGQITFSGGLPSGYTGSFGNVLSVTFRVVGAGTARVAVANASVLAADGMGTNVLTNMGNGTYTLSAVSTQPPAEVIMEFVPPANTPSAPQVRSSTHPNPDEWYTANSATLSWAVPAGVTAVRTLLNERSNSVPTRVYENPISEITLEELPEGESYFHIQFQNSDGWGRVTHYRLGVDTLPPQDFTVSLAEDFDPTSPQQTLFASTSDDSLSSPIVRYLVQINGQEPIELSVDDDDKSIQLPTLEPGYQTVVVEAFDAAGNSAVASRSFSILAFDKPVFNSIPARIQTGIIPLFQGVTRPNATVQVTLTPVDATPLVFEVVSTDEGEFTVILEKPLTQGVYDIVAVATDQHGAKSDPSDTIRFVVEEPGYVAFGSMIINILSLIVTLLALVALLIIIGSYLWLYVRRLRKRVSVEAEEVLMVLNRQFDELSVELDDKAKKLAETRKTGKLTKAEAELVSEVGNQLTSAKQKITKEITDVIGLVSKK